MGNPHPSHKELLDHRMSRPSRLRLLAAPLSPTLHRSLRSALSLTSLKGLMMSLSRSQCTRPNISPPLSPSTSQSPMMYQHPMLFPTQWLSPTPSLLPMLYLPSSTLVLPTKLPPSPMLNMVLPHLVL